MNECMHVSMYVSDYLYSTFALVELKYIIYPHLGAVKQTWLTLNWVSNPRQNHNDVIFKYLNLYTQLNHKPNHNMTKILLNYFSDPELLTLRRF